MARHCLAIHAYTRRPQRPRRPARQMCDGSARVALKEARMEITHKRLNRVDLLSVSGRLDAMSAPQFKQKIDELFGEGRYRLVLDLAGLEYVASPGLRVLIEARKRARDWKITDLEGGDVRIANLPPRIKEVFDLTGFTSLFEIYGDTTEAVGSF
jgi:anti-sigma B factor antagonist